MNNYTHLTFAKLPKPLSEYFVDEDDLRQVIDEVNGYKRSPNYRLERIDMIPNKLIQLQNANESQKPKLRRDLVRLFIELCRDDKIREFGHEVLASLDKIDDVDEYLEVLFLFALYKVEQGKKIPYETGQPAFDGLFKLVTRGGVNLTLQINYNKDLIVTNIDVNK